jgi:hypothetical protein
LYNKLGRPQSPSDVEKTKITGTCTIVTLRTTIIGYNELTHRAVKTDNLNGRLYLLVCRNYLEG